MRDRLDFDKRVMHALLASGFSVKSYHSYERHSDIVGQLRPNTLLKVPLRTMVEISRFDPTPETIDGFYNQAKNAQAQVMILVLEKHNKVRTDVSSLISKYGMELWTLDRLKNISSSKLRAAEKTLDAVSTSRLVNALPSLANQDIPPEIADVINDPKRQAWEVFEDAVVAVFRSCFNYKVRQFGKESRFESEPEGMVVTTGLAEERFAFIYDCKSAADRYTVDSKDESIYIRYIQEKKREARALEKCDLRYFLIIGPKFGGDMLLRRQNIMEKTQVVTIYLKSSDLKFLAQWVLGIEDPEVKTQIDLRKVFKLNEPEVSRKTIRQYRENFDARNRERY